MAILMKSEKVQSLYNITNKVLCGCDLLQIFGFATKNMNNDQALFHLIMFCSLIYFYFRGYATLPTGYGERR